MGRIALSNKGNWSCDNEVNNVVLKEMTQEVDVDDDGEEEEGDDEGSEVGENEEPTQEEHFQQPPHLT